MDSSDQDNSISFQTKLESIPQDQTIPDSTIKTISDDLIAVK